MQLRGLAGTRKIRHCEFVRTPAEAIHHLRKHVAVTAAGDRGAINMWDDNHGFYRCESMANKQTLDSQRYATLRDVRYWASIWFRRIN